MTNKVDYAEQFLEHGLYTPTRTIRITGEIDEDKYDSVVSGLHILDSSSGTINIIINSEGGSFRDGLAIYDSIIGCSNYVRIMCYGSCMSIATVILQAGDERLLSPHCLSMVHYGTNGPIEDNVANQERWYAQAKKDKKIMEDIYFHQIRKIKPRYRRKDLTEMLNCDTILSVKEMLNLGLADRIEECFHVK